MFATGREPKRDSAGRARHAHSPAPGRRPPRESAGRDGCGTARRRRGRATRDIGHSEMHRPRNCVTKTFSDETFCLGGENRGTLGFRISGGARARRRGRRTRGFRHVHRHWCICCDQVPEGRAARDPEFLAGFRAEARVMVELDDPDIVRLYEYVESMAGAAIVMELVDGVSLRRLLAEHGPRGPEAALSCSRARCSACPRRTRRDRAPGLQAGERAGPGRRHGEAERLRRRRAQRGESGLPAGTPALHGPRAVGGPPRVAGATPATDVYAATCVFFECLTGHRPYRADHPAR